MAIDLSATRARPSGERRRGRGSSIDAGGPTQQLRASTPHRPVASTPGAAFVEGLLPGLGQALQKFSQAGQVKDAIQTEKDKLNARLENAETLNKFRREVMENKDAVLEAVKTGDYSNLSFDATQFIDRKVIVDNVHTMVGQAQAYEDLPGLQEAINAEDDPMRLADVVRKWIMLQTQGVQSDFYATAYGDAIMAAGKKMIASRQSEIAKNNSAMTVQTIRGNLQNEIRNPGNIWDMDGLVAQADTVAAQLIAGGYSPEEAALLAPEMVDNAIIANLSKRPDLVSLLGVPDPTRQMTTIMDRYPGAVRQAIEIQINDEHGLYRAEGKRALHEINRGITTFGSGLQTMTLPQMFDQLGNVRQQFGSNSKEYRDTEERLLKLQGTVLKDQTDISMFMKGIMGPMSNDEYNKALDAAYLFLPNMTPEQQLNTLSVMANHGISGKLRQRLQRMLSGTDEQQREASTFIMALKDSAEHGDYDDYVDALPASRLKAEEYFSEMGMEPLEVKSAVAGITEAVDPFTYFEKSQLAQKTDGRGAGTGQGALGAHNVAMEVWDDYNDIWGPNDAADWDELPLDVRSIYKDAVNLAAYHLRDRAHDIDDVKALATEIAEGQLTYVYSTRDGMIPQRRVGVTTPRASSSTHMEAMRDEAARFVMDAEVQNQKQEGLPEIVSTRKDSGYRMGRGELVLVDHGDGIERPAYYAAGPEQTVTLPESLIPEEMRRTMVSIDSTIPGVFHGHMRAGLPGETVDLGNGFSMVYDEERSSWAMRWKMTPPEDVRATIEEVAAMGAQQETSIALQTTSEVRRNTFRAQIESRVKNGTLDEAIANKILNDYGLTEATNEGLPPSSSTFAEQMLAAIQRGEDEHFDKTSDRRGNGTSMLEQAGNFITKHESIRTQAYDDHTGQPIIPGRKVHGNPTIGHGFNLNRKDARKKIERMGYDFDKIKSGEQQITEADAIKLRDIVVQEEMNWLSGKLKRNGVDLTTLKAHHWVALLSASYNGRGLITKELISALATGDFESAEKMLRESRSKSHDRLPAHVQLGLEARRKKEANLFGGLK